MKMSLSRSLWSWRKTARSLALITLIAAVLAHWVEINFGIAIVSTRTHFWVYAGLLLAIYLHRALVTDYDAKLELMGPYLAEGSLGMNSRDGWDMWYRQAAAIMISDTWQFSLHNRDCTFNWDFFTFPKINPDVGGTFVGAVSDVLYIPVNSRYPEEATWYMDNFLSEEVQANWINFGLAFNAGSYYGLITEEKMGAANVKLMDIINEEGFTTWFDVGNPAEITDSLAANEFAALLNDATTVQDAANNIEAVAGPLFGR